MQNVPKIVTDRLRVAAPAPNHPDADVLTGFFERTLAERERALVLEHLARCRDCRDIVALAMPAAEPAQESLRPTPSGWLTWPVLRWGFVAAGILAIAGFGLVRYRRQSRPEMMAYSLSRPEPLAEGRTAKEAQNQLPPVPAAEASKEQREEKAPAGAVSADKETAVKPGVATPKEFDRLEAFSRLQSAQTPEKKVAGAVGGTIGGPLQLPHGPKVQWQQNANNFQNNANVQNNAAVFHGPAVAPPLVKQPPNAFMPASAAAPPASQAVAVESQGAQAQTQNQAALALPRQPMPLQPSQGGQDQMVERAKEPGVVFSDSAKTVAASPAAADARSFSLLVAASAGPNWSINAAGALQRSFDQGKTWQSVDVNGLPAAAGAGLALVSTAARAKAAESKADVKKDQAAQPAAMVPVFRAVAANGADVWAGGSNGILYHSLDSGAHWTRIQPSSAGTVLTGDIVSLDFPDSEHGRITTSAGEIWLTTDGGQSWQKQL